MALTIPAFLVVALMRAPGPVAAKVAKAIALGVVAVIAFAGFRVLRNVPVSELPSKWGEALSTPGNDISGGESRILGSFYYLLAADRTEHPYGDNVTAQRLVSIYVPRGGVIPKPNDVTYEIWSDYVDDGYLDRDPYFEEVRALADAESPGSDHPTVWGDAFANFRVVGVVLYALVLGAFAVFVDIGSMRLSTVARVLVLPVAAVTYQFIARGNVVIAVGYLAYGLPVVALMLAIVHLPILRRRQRSLGIVAA
jgi:hypothetical protein